MKNQKYTECADVKCQLPGWDFIYSLVFNYPKEQKDLPPGQALAILNFFTYLGKVIPCEEYRKHYNKFVLSDPIQNHLANQDDLLKWLYNINCKINDKINETNPNFDKLCTFYQKFKAGSCKKKNFKGKTCRKKSLKMISNMVKKHF